jgi:redox-sensitive bicupin YhaK (pirin superfamily)
MSVRFVLRAAERGHSFLPSTGPNASYVAGHPDGTITRRSSFNFHEYQSGLPGFGAMKVFGDEVFTPNGTGYNMHPHHNFIIMAFVLRGTLTHINTIGKVDELQRDDYYVFSAGSGGKHSELNIGEEDLNVIYVWVLPARLLMPPSYARRSFDRQGRHNKITCLVGEDAGALPIGQAFRLSRLPSDAGREYRWEASDRHGLYAFVLEGEAEIAGTRLGRRDSMGLEREQAVGIRVLADGTDMLLVETAL